MTPSVLIATPKKVYSPNPDINEAVLWLIERGYPALPVAPYQLPELYPRINAPDKGDRRFQGNYCPLDSGLGPIPLFCGKNPSYLDAQGFPHILSSLPFQERLPTEWELRRWFVHPNTGIATMGGWNDTVWIDIDSQHFASVNECLDVIDQYLKMFPALAKGFVEFTQSGGARIAVRSPQPNWSQFSLSPKGRHIGELLGKGKPAILAPTVGVKGNYVSLSRNLPIWVEDLADISLFPVGRLSPSPNPPTQKPKLRKRITSQDDSNSWGEWQGGSVSLYQVVSKRALEAAQQAPEQGERSDVLCKVIRDAFGWENWLTEQGIPLLMDAEEFCFRWGYEIGLDEGRVRRIINSNSNGVPIRESMPGVYHYRGDRGCYEVLYRRAKS